MKTAWLRIVIGLAVGLMAVAAGDTVKLSDGRVLEGNIVSDDDRSVVLEVEYAGGTIRQTLTLPKTNVVEVVRDTPEQRAEREMRQAYEALQRYQLSSQTAYAPAYYDQVISNVFLRFIAKYPDSPYVPEVSRKITDWRIARHRAAIAKPPAALVPRAVTRQPSVSPQKPAGDELALPPGNVPERGRPVSRSVLDDFMEWLDNNWMIAAGGLLVIVLLVWKLVNP